MMAATDDALQFFRQHGLRLRVEYVGKDETWRCEVQDSADRVIVAGAGKTLKEAVERACAKIRPTPKERRRHRYVS